MGSTSYRTLRTLIQAPVQSELPGLSMPAHDNLRGMAAALEHQLASPDTGALPFEDRLALLLQHEAHSRKAQRLGQRLRWAKLTQSACLEDLDTRTPRGI